MYYGKMIQWVTHFELEIRNLHVVLRQLIRVEEYAGEGKLHSSTIFKAQLQEVITKIYTRIKEYKFRISTSHIRVELLSQIIRCF